MAEIICCVEVAIKLLTPLIKSEASLILGLQNEVLTIKGTLTRCLHYLNNEDRRADENEFLKDWVKHVQIFSHGIEDVVEEYNLLEKENAIIDYVNSKRYLNKRSIATEIKSLHNMATQIVQWMNASNHSETVSQQGATGRMNMAEDFDLVGGETAKADLIELLRLQELEDSGLSIIAVIGMTGLGKTAIVGSVYNDPLVRDFFPIQAWLSLSQPYNYEHILKTMFKQFMETAQVSEPSFLNSELDYIGTKWT